jgi:hypothetical protein
MGMVRYMDYTTERLPTLNMFEYITHKNLCFEYEQELRAVAMHPLIEGLDQQHFQEHHFQSDDLASLAYAPPLELAIVGSVVLHPSAPEAFVKQVTSLCQESGLPLPQKSVLPTSNAPSESAPSLKSPL